MPIKNMIITLFVLPVSIYAQNVNVSSGKIQRIEMFASRYVQPRNVDVWLPDNYSTEEKYAVLYMHDGQMLYDATTTWNGQEWGLDETMGKLLAEQKIRDCIVVGIWNTENRNLEYAIEDGHQYFDSAAWHLLQTDEEAIRHYHNKAFIANNYLQFIVNELKPYIDNNFSTYTDRQNTFIAGSSRGGLISLYAICKYPEVFGGAACLSTHWTGLYREENNPFPDAYIKYLQTHVPDPATHNIYFDYGTVGLDTLYANTQYRADEIMKLKGYTKKNWMTRKYKGANHSETDWNARLHIPLEFLLKE